MSEMTEHPDQLLSAYLDDALWSGERETVQVHLADCARCRDRVAELRAVSRLLAALPRPSPSRSLVPRLDAARGPVWLRPVRLLGAMGSGVFLFLFLASAVLNSGSSLGGGTSTAERLAEKGQFGAAANALASDAAQKRAAATATGLPAVVQGTGTPGATGQLDAGRGTTASGASGSPAPTGNAAFAPPNDTGNTATYTVTYRPPLGPSPQLFLGLAFLCGLVAFVAHRRLRRT